MQNTRTSKSLSTILASATFRATQLNATRAFEDILFAELISHQDTLCYQLLSTKLSAAELQHITLQIERIVVGTTHPPTELSLGGITPEIYYRDMLSAISTRYPTAQRLSTIHALHVIASDPETIASTTLSHLGITLSILEGAIAEYSATNSLSPLIEMGSRSIEQKQHPLEKFGVDMTAMAQRGEIDPVVGRDIETDRVIEILARRKKNNPILIGEAGVGKSAIVEGLALRIIAGDVPPRLRDKRLFSLEVSSLIAGTKFRGEFEERMQQLLAILRESGDAIVFIDEIHTIVGAGATQGSLDTANILKPALARGEIQTIGATTLDEYRTHIESDSALERRLQKVMVQPTSVEASIEILHRIAPKYEVHHNVTYSSEAIEACVYLSQRYITDRNLPDKAIDLMDEAGARAHISSQNIDIAVIGRDDIERIITATTGIPIERISGNEIARLRNLERHLGDRIIGQEEAVRRLSRTIQRSRTGLNDATRPVGVFMLVGPTGVGKTHLAKELSRWMFGEESRNLIRIDMSEYGERHNVSRLIGSPPGYVGYGEGGELSEAVRRAPYSVVLLDEIEKAHPEIFNVMLQIFDEGHLTDGSGRHIDFRNTIIIMTSNVGSRSLAKRPSPMGFSTQSKISESVRTPEGHYTNSIERHFSPEFINRIDEILLFRQLNIEHIERITEIELERIFERTRAMGYKIRITPSARRELASMGYHSQYGARALKRILAKRIEEPLSEMIIEGDITEGREVVIERNRRGEGVRLKVA